MQEPLFYHLNNARLEEVADEHVHSGDNIICYLDQEQLKTWQAALGIDENVLLDLSNEKVVFRSSLDVYADTSVGYINIINVDDLESEMDRIMFIIKRNLLCMVSIEDRDNSERLMFQKIIEQEKQKTNLAKIFYRYLERLLKGGNSKLEVIEDKLLSLEDEVVHGRADEGLNKVIYRYRRQLSLIRNYYEQLVDIAGELEENENNVYDKKGRAYFRVLCDKGDRLVSGVRALDESLTSIREMLDASLNYNLNSIMKTFTLITAVFLPLTLIVGWFGMNFKHMPELEWRYAYPLLIVVCVLLVLGILFYFKKRKWM